MGGGGRGNLVLDFTDLPTIVTGVNSQSILDRKNHYWAWSY